MSTSAGRSTFLEIREVVERTRRYAERAHDLLIHGMRERNPDQRTRIFLDLLEQERGALEESIDRSLEAAPKSVLETRAQYTVDPWEADPEAPRCSSIEEATRWILELDEQILETYRELADRSDSEGVSEFCESLAGLVRAHDQRLARESQNSHDV